MKYAHYDQRWESQVVDLWNRCCTFDPSDVQKFRVQALFDDNFDPELSWVALEGDRGGSSVIRRHEDALRLVEAAEPELSDCDTKQALEILKGQA